MLCEKDFAEEADKLLLGEAGGAQPNPDESLTEAEFLISGLKDNGIVDDMTVDTIRLQVCALVLPLLACMHRRTRSHIRATRRARHPTYPNGSRPNSSSRPGSRRSQFAHIVRHDTEAADAATRVLDDSVLFRELLSQGRIRQSLPAVPAGRGVTARGAGSSSHRKSQLSERGHPIDYVDLRAADGGLREWRERFWWPRVYDGETHAPVVRLEMQHGATRESPGGKNGGLRGTPSKNKVRLPLIACPRLPHR